MLKATFEEGERKRVEELKRGLEEIEKELR